MKIIYLKDGCKCCLKDRIGEKYIVNKIFECEKIDCDGDSEIVEIIDNTDIIVDAVFKKPPTEKYSMEITSLNLIKNTLEKEVQELKIERSKLNVELNKLLQTKIAHNEFIINKTELINAKTIAIFPKDMIMPLVLNSKEKEFVGLKIFMEFELYSNTEYCWGCKISTKNEYKHYSTSDFLCPKYGILINPTEDIIEETIKKRLSEIEFSDYKIAKTDDKYLTPRQIEIKNDYLVNQKKKELMKFEKEFEKIQEKIKELKELEIYS